MCYYSTNVKDFYTNVKVCYVTGRDRDMTEKRDKKKEGQVSKLISLPLLNPKNEHIYRENPNSKAKNPRRIYH